MVAKLLEPVAVSVPWRYYAHVRILIPAPSLRSFLFAAFHALCALTSFQENVRCLDGEHPFHAHVQVHCRAGISRSASLVLAHMLLSRAAMGSPITLRDAVAHAKARRACVSPNEGFMAQLCALEERLTGAVTVDIGKYKPRRFGAVQEYAIGEVQTLTWEV